jgi:hypothetical protein
MRLRYLSGPVVLTLAIMVVARAFGAGWTYEERLDQSRSKIYVARSGVDLGFECGSNGPALWVKLTMLGNQPAGTEATIGFVTARTGLRQLMGQPRGILAFGKYAHWASPLGLPVPAAQITGNQVLDIAQQLSDANEVTVTVEPRRPKIGLTDMPTKSESKVSLAGASDPLKNFLRNCPQLE